MHLHATVNDLFWEVRGLEVVESHAGDPMYCSKKAKQQLEEKDKFLKASIAVTDFDSLVRGHVSRKLGKPDEASLSEIVRDTWIAIGRGSLDPSMFIEDEETIRDRLRRVIAFFGRERVAYAGPECGLRGFPKYDAALELLRRVARASHSI
jgi:methionine synthase II (cobalamin-independent)